MTVNKELIAEYLKNSNESPAELLTHLNTFLGACKKYHNSFTANPHYALYLEKAKSRDMLPKATQNIVENQNELGPLSQAFLEPTYENKIRKKF